MCASWQNVFANREEHHAQQAPSYAASGAPVARNEAPPRLVPISSLNAYQNRWTIRARVTARSDMRRFQNSRGEGKFFTVHTLLHNFAI